MDGRLDGKRIRDGNSVISYQLGIQNQLSNEF